jgi:hypothetical protein
MPAAKPEGLSYFETASLRRPDGLRAGWNWRWRIVVGRILVVWAYWLVIIAILIVVVILVAFWRWLVRVVGSIAVIRRGRCVCGVVVLTTLRSLLALAVLHLRLLEQPTFLGSLLAFRAVFNLVRTNQGVWRNSKDVFVFAEFADPQVIASWTVVVVRILLLHFALSSC